ncbi:unnamed protein product [marine sediment metagenome]|uniref:Uncharacterized protein n=1 Tax=marine sediment metagenome TaxID=412755 RepID=X1BTK3_9ZZZZ
MRYKSSNFMVLKDGVHWAGATTESDAKQIATALNLKERIEKLINGIGNHMPDDQIYSANDLKKVIK